MSVLTTLRIAGSALTAQRLRMDVTASNVANAETTRASDGGPYRRASVVFAPLRMQEATAGAASASKMEAPGGVEVRAVIQDSGPPREVHDPGHPDADADGNVAYPNVDLVTEMTDMMAASRAYEANITIISAIKNMAQRAIDIARL